MPCEIYFDNNATTRPLAEVRDAVVRAMGPSFGNPSSGHSAGDRTRDVLRDARRQIASLLGAETGDFVFTSGGTEANNLVFRSAVARCGASRCRIVTSSTEHSSVLKIVEHLENFNVEVVVVPVGEDGRVDFDLLSQEITPETSLVSIQWVNNETGVIQPIEEIARLCKSQGVPFHTDACQAVGKLPIKLATLPIDMLTMTAHKLHGPQGVGAIYVRKSSFLVPVFYGGGQEQGLRPGTENVPGIAGFAAAADVRQQDFQSVTQGLARLRDFFERLVLEFVPGVTVNGNVSHRVCNTTNLCFHGVDGQALVGRLDQEGIRCSQSSACTNQRPEPSYVLRAMGLSEEDAYASVRFSFGVSNTEKEAEVVAKAIRELCIQLRGFTDQIHNPYQTARK